MKPILFNTEMVRAILEGRKTVTRRVIKPQPLWIGEHDIPFKTPSANPKGIINPPYQPGDILYVRETWCHHKIGDWYGYRADGDYRDLDLRWKPSIHMPKEAARIFLKVTDVRVERLQEITEMQVIREGFSSDFDIETNTFYSDGYFFVKTWDDIYKGKGYGWETNPWVWVIEFERAEKEGVL